MPAPTHIATPWGVVALGTRTPAGMRPMPAGGRHRPLDPATGAPIPFTPRQIQAALAGLVAGEPVVGLADLDAIREALDAMGRGFAADRDAGAALVAEEGIPSSPSGKAPLVRGATSDAWIALALLALLAILVGGGGLIWYMSQGRK